MGSIFTCTTGIILPRTFMHGMEDQKPKSTRSTEMADILRITDMEQVGTYSLKVSFNDGTTKRVNLRPLLWGEVFEPLRDPDRFSEVYLDEKMGTVAWPNGADLAPEALYDLEEEQAVA